MASADTAAAVAVVGAEMAGRKAAAAAVHGADAAAAGIVGGAGGVPSEAQGADQAVGDT